MDAGIAVVVAAVFAAVAAALAVGEDRFARLRPREGPAPGGRVATDWVHRNLGSRRRREREVALLADVPTVCDLLAVCVEAGHPTRAALRVVAEVCADPTREVLLAVWNQIDLGVPEPQAWASLAEVPGYRAVGRDLARAVRTGAGLGQLLRERGREARDVVATAARVRARGVAVTGVLPLVLCYLPAFLLVGVVPILGDVVSRFLFG